MSPVTTARTALLAVLLAAFAVASDKTQHIYQKGTIEDWENRPDFWGAGFVGPETLFWDNDRAPISVDT